MVNPFSTTYGEAEMEIKAIGYDWPSWGKYPSHTDADEQRQNAYETEIESLIDLRVSELQRDGHSPDMKISFMDVMDEIVFTQLTGNEKAIFNLAIHDIYKGCPTLQTLFDKNIEYVVRIAAEREMAEK